MATAGDLITLALQEIGATSIIKPAAPETEQLALTLLNQMFNAWIKKDIILGDAFVLPTKLSDEMNNDPDTDEPIYLGLMMRVAGPLRKDKEITLVKSAKAGAAYQDLLAAHVKRPEMPYPNTLHRGAGRRRAPFSNDYYVEPQRKDTLTVKADPQ